MPLRAQSLHCAAESHPAPGDDAGRWPTALHLSHTQLYCVPTDLPDFNIESAAFPLGPTWPCLGGDGEVRRAADRAQRGFAPASNFTFEIRKK